MAVVSTVSALIRVADKATVRVDAVERRTTSLRIQALVDVVASEGSNSVGARVSCIAVVSTGRALIIIGTRDTITRVAGVASTGEGSGSV